MLDRMCAGTDRVFHAFSRVGMGCHAATIAASFGDARSQFFLSQLRTVRQGPRCQDATGGNELDHVRSSAELLSHCVNDSRWAIRLAANEASMTAGHANRQPGCLDAWSREEASLNGLLQCKNGMVPEPKVTDRGESGLQGPAR